MTKALPVEASFAHQVYLPLEKTSFIPGYCVECIVDGAGLEVMVVELACSQADWPTAFEQAIVEKVRWGGEAMFTGNGRVSVIRSRSDGDVPTRATIFIQRGVIHSRTRKPKTLRVHEIYEYVEEKWQRKEKGHFVLDRLPQRPDEISDGR